MAVEEADYTVGFHGLRFIVRHHHYCRAILPVEPMKQFHHICSHFGIKITGRLIGKDYLRGAYYGPRYCNSLTLTS